MEDHSAIHQEVVNHFKGLYEDKPTVKVELKDIGLAKLPRETKDHIERPVTPEEVKIAVWSCDSKKAPGYDGFNFGFIKKMWDIVGQGATSHPSSRACRPMRSLTLPRSP